jgi:ribose/xylose/arabinose/galactoside ABC-type transport system permease subunit
MNIIKRKIDLNKIIIRNSIKKRIKSLLNNQQTIIFFVLILIICVFATINPVFLSIMNLTNILKVASIIGISAIGMTLVIILGGIDLSVGSILALGGALGAGLLGLGFGASNPIQLPFFIAFCLAITVTLAIGGFNGFIVSKFSIAPFAVTLGMMLFIRGFAYVFIHFVVQGVPGTPITFMHPAFSFLGDGLILGIFPTQAIVFFGLAIIFNIILSSTQYGRNIMAIGGGNTIAHLAGINVEKTTIITYMIMGGLAGLSGLVFVGRLSAASPLLGNGFELDVITAVIIGGTSMSGGKGTIAGTVLGVLLLGVLNNGLEIIHLPSFYQYLVKGTILIIAVILDKTMNKQKRYYDCPE